jgi:hypothetical protein
MLTERPHVHPSSVPIAAPVDPGEDVVEAGLPQRIVVGANGAYWRDFGSHYSMPPVSEDNDPVRPVAIYVRDYLDPILDKPSAPVDRVGGEGLADAFYDEMAGDYGTLAAFDFDAKYGTSPHWIDRHYDGLKAALARRDAALVNDEKEQTDG